MPLTTFTPSTKAKSAEVNANFQGLADGSLMNSPTIASATLSTKFIAKGLYDNGNSGATPAINWTNGDRQLITLTANATFTYSNAAAGQALTLIIKQDGTGSRTVAMPAGTKWPYGSAGSFSTVASSIDVLTVVYDGTNYYTQLAASFA